MLRYRCDCRVNKRGLIAPANVEIAGCCVQSCTVSAKIPTKLALGRPTVGRGNRTHI